MPMIHIDDYCLWYMPMIHIDDYCLWYMVMIHIDETCSWYIWMIIVYDTCSWYIWMILVYDTCSWHILMILVYDTCSWQILMILVYDTYSWYRWNCWTVHGTDYKAIWQGWSYLARRACCTPCWGVEPLPPMGFLEYDIKLHIVMKLLFWSSRKSGCTSSLPLLLDPPSFRMVAPVRVPSMSQIDLF